ncbi:MAG: hypothetical protein OEU36_19170, partial [Gammaproteobacteria bacterium]|nr:hypothetical protein [Gammaproteobacteria bacterium]
MKKSNCPYCKEEIKFDALVCKHCRERLFRSREEMVMAAVSERFQAAHFVEIPSVSRCGALCYAKFSGNKVQLQECLDNCKAATYAAEVAERMQRQLFETFADIIWGGGDIDPLPLEQQVRERFAGFRKAA